MLAAAALVGLIDGFEVMLFPVVALLAGWVGWTEPADRTAQAIGATVVGVMAIASALIGSPGALELGVALGATGVVAVSLVKGELRWRPMLAAVAVVAIALALVNLVPLVLDGGGLAHDESAYALKARHWHEGTPETGWNLHRGIAMSAFGYVVLGWGGTEAGLRILGIVALTGLVFVTWALGRRMADWRVGTVAALALLSSPALLRRSTEYLSDVPSAALLGGDDVVDLEPVRLAASPYIPVDVGPSAGVGCVLSEVSVGAEFCAYRRCHLGRVPKRGQVGVEAGDRNSRRWPPRVDPSFLVRDIGDRFAPRDLAVHG